MICRSGKFSGYSLIKKYFPKHKIPMTTNEMTRDSTMAFLAPTVFSPKSFQFKLLFLMILYARIKTESSISLEMK